MEKVIKYIPVIGALLIFFGFTALHIYYQSFGISIYPYLDTGELILSFLPTINLIAIFLITLSSFPIIALLRNIKFGSKRRNKNRYYSYLVRARKQGRFKNIISKNKLRLFFISEFLSFLVPNGILMIIFIYGVFDFVKHESDPYGVKNFWLYMLSCFVLIKIYVIDELKKKFQNLNKIRFDVIYFVVIFYLGLILVNGRLANKVMHEKKGYSSSFKIVTRDSTYTSDAKTFLIGQTRNFIFIRNKIDTSNIIIPRAEVLSYSISERK